jgi:hypothetical protein
MRIVTATALALGLLSLTACTKPWKEYSYPAWGFSVSFREVPHTRDKPGDVRTATPHVFQVEAVQGDMDFRVSATDANSPDKTEDQIRASAPNDIIRSSSGTVKGPLKAVTASGVAGQELTLDRGSDPTERVRVFVVNHKLYQVIAQSPDIDSPEVAAFLDSFKINK